MKIKSRQDWLVVLTLGVVALAVTVNFILPPVLGWWSDRQKQIRELGNRVKEGNVTIRRETALRSHWDEMRHNALPGTKAEPGSMPPAEQQFLKALDGWARDSGAEITSIMPQWKNTGTNYATLDCRVETSGELSVLSRFIYEIEKGPLMVRLDSVELSAHDANGQQMTLGVEINGLALLEKDKK